MSFKKLIYTLFFATLITTANADMYVSAGIGYTDNNGSVTHNNVHSKYDPSPSYSLAVGYEMPFSDLMRAEVEYFHNRTDSKKNIGKVTIDALMGNAYVSIPLPLPLLTPYVGAGLGYARMENDNLAMYQGIIGIDAEVFVIPMVASLEYRYATTNRSSSNHKQESKYKSNILMAKIRYEF